MPEDFMDDIVAKANAAEGSQEGGPGEQGGQNQEDYFKLHFEPLGFPDVDAVKNRLNIFKDVPEDIIPDIPNIKTWKENSTKIEGLTKENEGLKTQVADLSKFNPYQDDNDLYSYYELKKTKPEEAALYKQIVFGNMNDLALVKLDLQLKHPELKAEENQATLERKVKRLYPGLYPQGDEEEVDKTSESYLNAIDDLKLDAQEIKRTFSSKYQFEPPKKPTAEEIQAKKSELVTKWNPVFEKLGPELSKMKIDYQDPFDKEKKKMKSLEFDIPKEVFEATFNAIKGHVLNLGMEPDEQGKTTIANLVRNMILTQNTKLITDKLVESVHGEIREYYKKLTNNNNGYYRPSFEEIEGHGDEFDEKAAVREIKRM